MAAGAVRGAQGLEAPSAVSVSAPAAHAALVQQEEFAVTRDGMTGEPPDQVASEHGCQKRPPQPLPITKHFVTRKTCVDGRQA